MRVLVTGASGVFGREIMARLVARGHAVVGLSRRRPAGLPEGVEFVAADIRDADAVARAVEGCDSVAHCAWVVGALHDADQERAVNIGGTEHVLAGMQRAGTSRIVFASSSTAYGPTRGGPSVVDEATPLRPHPDHPYACHKAEVEARLRAADVDAVTIRTAVVLGRGIDNRIWSFMAAPAQVAIRGRETVWQVVHADDVGRFFVQACEAGPAGPVNLAAPGTFSSAELAEALGRPLVNVPERALRGAVKRLWDRRLLDVSAAELDFLVDMPEMDTGRLTEDWGFECAWSARETMEDTRLATLGVAVVGTRTVGLPWRVRFDPRVPTGHEPPADGASLTHAASDDLRGELDTPLDPRFPAYTTTNVGEILPGPATPLSLSVTGRGLRAAGSMPGILMGFTGVLGHEAHVRFQSIFGHRLFVNASCAIALGRALPGWDEDAIVQQYMGRHAGAIEVEGDEPPPPPPPRSRREAAAAGVGLARRGLGLLAGYSGDVDELVRQTARLEVLARDPRSMSDARLEAVASLARDLITHGWRLAGYGAVLAGAGTAAAERMGADTSDPGAGAELTSANGLTGVHQLAASARRQPEVSAVLVAGGDDLYGRVAAVSAEFRREVDDALERFGHRGPGECELESRSFIDDPDVLLRTVAKLVASSATPPPRPPAPSGSRGARLARGVADRFTAERERGRDRVVRLIWVLRSLVRERGRRLVEAGVVDHADDVYYLVFDELFATLPDTRALVARRRSERARLEAVRMPAVFSGSWTPEAIEEHLTPGETLDGVGASPGRAKGRVRIVSAQTVDDLESGEILVASVTDVGYTPMFANAAAVVTDIGGIMSHAAVVAREFQIPAVTDCGVATARLADGMLVEVDGIDGTVTVVEV